jgi:hypothetical protein
MAMVDTDYGNIPDHRGHTVEIQGWNPEFVMLVIHSKDRTNEALITPEQLRDLADRAEADAGRW